MISGLGAALIGADGCGLLRGREICISTCACGVASFFGVLPPFPNAWKIASFFFAACFALALSACIVTEGESQGTDRTLIFK